MVVLRNYQPQLDICSSCCSCKHAVRYRTLNQTVNFRQPSCQLQGRGWGYVNALNWI